MLKIVVLLMLVASIASAAGYDDVEIMDSNIDADGLFFVVARGPAIGSDLALSLCRITVQCRPLMSNFTQSFNGDWPTDFWGFYNQSFDGAPDLVARSAIVDSVGFKWVTFTGTTEFNDTSYHFSDGNPIEWRVSFITSPIWSGQDGSRSQWYKLDSDPVTPNPGANLTVVAENIATDGLFFIYEENSVGYYQVKMEYWDTDITDWVAMIPLEGGEWSQIAQGSPNVYLDAISGHQSYCTDGTTRVYYKDVDGNEGGPYAGPNLIGVDGITGVCP